MKWRTADGRDIELDQLTHQHASNIIWFYDLLLNKEHHLIRTLINEKFGGVVLDFKPLPIEGEIKALHQEGLILRNGGIIKKIGLNKFALIGSVNHIPNWEKMIKG